jgi:hypothetical protein
MVTLVACRFIDGYSAYYIKGSAHTHLVAEPGKTIFIMWNYDRAIVKNLKIKYSTWANRVRKKEVKA